MHPLRVRGGAPQDGHAALDPRDHGPGAATRAGVMRPGARMALPISGDGRERSGSPVGPRGAVAASDCCQGVPPGQYGTTVQSRTPGHSGPRKRKGNL